MEITQSTLCIVNDASQVSEVRRTGDRLSQDIGFSEELAGKLAIIITEAATNLIKHAQGGEIIFRVINSADDIGIEIMVLDKGKGMADLQACMADGYSTAGSMGTGLGAIKRMSDRFEVFSAPGKGTVLLSRIFASRSRSNPPEMITGTVCIPIQGETLCGDGWAKRRIETRYSLIVSDGLGHGASANKASAEALRIFSEYDFSSPVKLLEVTNNAMKATRGAAVAIAIIDLSNNIMKYAGVGNISGVIINNNQTKHLISHNGTLGHQARKFQEFPYDFPEGAMLIMNSDGILSQWSIDGYPGLSMRDPSIIAAVIYRDFTRGRDDVTVLVSKRMAA